MEKLELVITDADGSLTIAVDYVPQDEWPPQTVQVYPTHWLGDHHPSLERFRWELQQVKDQGPLEVEAWSREYIQAAALALTEGLWAIFNYEVVSDEGGGGDPAAGELPDGGIGQHGNGGHA